MRYADKQSWVTDYCYKIYLKEKNQTILVWRKSCYNYGFGWFIVLPYSPEHRKITNIKTFNSVWNESFTDEKAIDLKSESYDLSHKDFENYIKKEVNN